MKSPTSGFEVLATVDRRTRRQASIRRELLQAGRTLFGDKGLYESRVEEITERADIGKGTLYRYFRSKEELIRAVVETGFCDLREKVHEAVSSQDGLQAKVEAIVRAHLEFFTGNPDLMRIFHQVRGMLKFDRPEWLQLRSSLTSHLAFLAAELRAADRKSRMSAARSRDLAILIFGTISGTLSVIIAAEPRADTAAAGPGLVEALGRTVTRFAARWNGQALLRVKGKPATPARNRRRPREAL